MSRLLVALSLATALTSAGCAVRPPRSYRLVQNTLIPPGARSSNLARRTIVTDVPLALPRCAAHHMGIDVVRSGNRARVTVTKASLSGRPRGWLAIWAAELESQGCVAPGQGLKLAAVVAESLPSDLSTDFRLLQVDDRQASYVDLGPENRLQVDSPIHSNDAAAGAPAIESTRIDGLTVEVRASQNLLGYERAWYALRAKQSGYGFEVVALWAEIHIRDTMDRRPNPAVNYFHFAPQAAFYRLLYRGDQTIVMVSAPTRSELDRETQALRKNPGACSQFPPLTCVLVPNMAGVNADIVASVNGRDVALPIGSKVRDAIRAAGEWQPENLGARLSVRKAYAGKLAPVEFSPADPRIFDLTLLGGEEIFWQ